MDGARLMAGETDLGILLRSMRPLLRDGEYAFCTVDGDRVEVQQTRPLGWFCEAEGTTLILERDRAEALGLEHSAAMRCITLTVHSSLEAVGFLAAVSAALAAAGISVNAVSAFYHDHLFVPADRADESLRVLDELAHHPHQSPEAG
jgi:hypothetical protein